MAKYIVGIIFIILVTGAGYYFWKMQGDTGKGVPLNTVSYVCSEAKTIQASYYADSVDLVLSDGRSFSLPQTVSASGARYANADEAVVFWNKGTSALITEGSSDNETFVNCGEGQPSAPQANTYTNASSTWSVNYPTGFTVDDTYKYTGVSEAKPISGVKFTIPLEMATGTNLSADSYVSVEWLPRATTCVADIYVLDNVKPVATDVNGHSYSVATTSDAGAGNRYDQEVYAVPGSSPCTAVRYYIHSTAIGNYPAGTVREFDRASLIAAFDSVRDSLTFLTPAPTTNTSTTTTP